MGDTSRFGRFWQRKAVGIGTAMAVGVIGLIAQDLWADGGWTGVIISSTASAYRTAIGVLWPHGVYILILTLGGTAFWRKLSELRDIYSRLPGLLKKPAWRYVRYDKWPRHRWENIETVCFGHIRYPGLLNYDNSDAPVGFGVKIIRELFNTTQFSHDRVVIEPSPKKSDWRDVLDQLEIGDFDFVATPMLETFERSCKADFTMPMFFSNIGLYISSQAVGAGLGGQEGFKEETLDSVVAKLSRRQDIPVEIYYVPGEISEKQGRKLYERLLKVIPNAVKIIDAGDMISTMLGKVEMQTAGIRLAFCESFHVQISRNHEELPYRLHNSLQNYHILYPVCYAVRNGDYVLRNRINIGLLKMTAEGDGILRRLSDALSLNREALQAHFVSGWSDPRKKEAEA